MTLFLNQPHRVQLEFHFVLPHYPLLTYPDSFRDIQFVPTLGVRYTFTKSSFLMVHPSTYGTVPCTLRWR